MALGIVSLALLPNPPGDHATVAKVVNFYHAHKGQTTASAYLIEAAVCLALFVYWYLRECLVSPANRRLVTVGFAGAAAFAVSGGVVAGMAWALANAADHTSPTTMQTLNVLQNDLTTFLGAAGAAAFLLATGAAVVRGAPLPRWLGWVGLVLGIASLVVPFVAVGAIMLWTLIACVALLVRAAPGLPSNHEAALASSATVEQTTGRPQ